MTTDFLTGTVKCPGELPHEYLFITKDNEKLASANLLNSLILQRLNQESVKKLWKLR